MNIVSKYEDMTINQKITMKGILSSKRYRELFLGRKMMEDEHTYYDLLGYIAKIDSYKNAINFWIQN